METVLHGNQCKSYKDCPCHKTKECACRDGTCMEEKWECQEDEDCNKMKKCSEKNCLCHKHLCEIAKLDPHDGTS